MSFPSSRQIQNVSQQSVGGSLKDTGEQVSSNCISNNNQQQQQQLVQKRDGPPISLLQQNQQKGTSLASVTQISKLLDDYEQYLNLQSNKLKMMQAPPKNNLHQPIKKVFENMISPMNPQQSPLIPSYKQQHSKKTKFRSNSNHQPSTQNNLYTNSQIHHTPKNKDNQEMIKRINASKIFQAYTNQDTSETNNSFTNLDQILPQPNQQDLKDRVNAENQLNNQGGFQTPNRQMLPQLISNRKNYNSQTPKHRLNHLRLIKDENVELLPNYEEQNKTNVEESPSKSLKLIKRKLPNKIACQQFTNPYNRQLDLYNDSFIVQDDPQQPENQSPISLKGKVSDYKSQSSMNQQNNGYSNLLKQNTKVNQQYIIPKINYSSQNSQSSQKQQQLQQQNNDIENDFNNNNREGISAFQQSLLNQQNDPSNFQFINLQDNLALNSNQVLISPRRQLDAQTNSANNKQNRERAHRIGINPNRQIVNLGARFLPQINSPINQQNGDNSNILISGNVHLHSSQIEEQIKQSKEIYGKKYFNNLKIESLIKEYEKRSIKNLFDAQILLSQKKNQIEISRAIEEKKKKEQKQTLQNNNGKRSTSELLKGNKDDSKYLDNLQVNLSKSAMTNKLERDLKHFRERTKSSLIRGVQEIQLNDFKTDVSSIIYGQTIKQKSTPPNQPNQVLTNNNHQSQQQNTDYGYNQPINYVSNQRGNFQSQQNQNMHIKRGNNSIDLTINQLGQQNTSMNNDMNILTSLTQRNYQHNSPVQNSFSNDLNKEKDILDNFLKNINLKKKFMKLNDIQNTSCNSPSNINNTNNNINNKTEPRQCLILSPVQLEQNQINCRQLDNRLPLNCFDNEQQFDKSKTFNEQFSTDSTSIKNQGFPTSTKSKSSPRKKKNQSNHKKFGQETLSVEDHIQNGGWETKTNSNFDQLYSLFK